jgi:hypothetical protein
MPRTGKPYGRNIQRSLVLGSQALSGEGPFGALRSPIGGDEAVAGQMAGFSPYVACLASPILRAF